ncbi:MAG: lipase maturation factor family protein [Myxococcota bacterium]
MSDSSTSDEPAAEPAGGVDPDNLERPLLVWDGTCGFCRRSVEVLRDHVGDAVDIETYQDVHEQFDDVDESDFANAVHLFEPDGRYYTAAEAIFRALDKGPGSSMLLWLYLYVPGFAAIMEVGYRWVANHRPLVSRLTRWGFGEDMRAPDFRLSRWMFLRALGLVALVAFLSFFVQYEGLVSSEGILPFAEYLDMVRENAIASGRISQFEAYWKIPTVLWASASDAAIGAVCLVGIAASALLTIGVWPRATLVVMLVSYSSVCAAGRIFLGFQWDSLLVEALFFSLFVAPATFFDRARKPVSGVQAFLIVWIVFRLHFMSGVVKLWTPGPTWHDLSAMTYHFWTQPIPTWTAYYAHQLPEFVLEFATLATLVLEIAVPLLLLGPRRFRRWSAALLAGLQMLILATGNYAFFNYLTLALCILAIDDEVWRRVVPDPLVALLGTDERMPVRERSLGWRRWALVGLAAASVTVGTARMYEDFTGTRIAPDAVVEFSQSTRIINNYGLFRVMTTDRPEILIQGSNDGRNWKTYDFGWKPDDLSEKPSFVAPHQPRLDWQMWFAALGSCQNNRWVLAVQRELLEGSEPVEALLAEVPFDEPPKYMRTVMYDYRFAPPARKAETGQWWVRDNPRRYCPPVELRDGQVGRAPVATEFDAAQ